MKFVKKNMKPEVLITDLIERTRTNMNQAEALRDLPDEVLTWSPREESWNILECLEHLNRYGDFYLPEIEKRVKASSFRAEDFKSGWLGEYFAKSMLPREKLNKMKTFKKMDPMRDDLNKPVLNREVIDEFIKQQKQTLDLLHKSREVSLKRTKTAISISSWIKLRLGDTFRVLIYHNQRHMEQVSKILKAHPDCPSKLSGYLSLLL